MSKKKIGFLFPGQGAQYPGMGKDFFEGSPEARAVFEEADILLGYSFSDLIFNGPAEELTLTKNSQLAIFITSMAILRVIEARMPEWEPYVCAGLSLGEYTALVAAKKITFAEGLKLVKVRGEAMQAACETHPGSMSVVLGLELAVIEEVVESIDGVWVANLNCPGQIVLSGTIEGLEKATLLLKEKGARRIMPLEVSGAFHSGLMKSAQEALTPYIHCTAVEPSSIQFVMNVPGNFVLSPEEIYSNLIAQVTHPVLWQKGVENMVLQGVELFIEMGPGKTLAGMNKRIGVSVPTLSVEKMEDLYATAAR